nr:recombination regulator RecX [Paenisporosarcina cavernae]
MPTITKISRQKNNQERYNIYLDGKYEFAVDEAVLVQYELAKDRVLEDWERDEILFDEEVQKSFNKALHFLGFRMRSEKEVKDKLKKLGYGEAVIIEAVRKLYTLGFLNDEEFSKALMQTKKNSNKQGPRAIQQELMKKGIDKKLQESILNDYSEEDQLATAREIRDKVIRKLTSKTPSQTKNKIQETLMRKGFNFEIIRTVNEEVEWETETEEWLELISAQGEKVWDKFAKKYSGYERTMRVKQALYQKGFPSEQIDNFIERKVNEENGEEI